MGDIYTVSEEVKHLIKIPTRKKLITGKYRPWCNEDKIKMHKFNITLLLHYRHPHSVATIFNLQSQIKDLRK